MTWGSPRYKVEQIGGISTLPLSDPRAIPIKASRVALKPVTKIFLSDWPWFADRSITDARSAWHNDKGKPFFPTLYGDNHVQNFMFPANYQSLDGQPVDLNWAWW
jgi:hypothetical protein